MTPTTQPLRDVLARGIKAVRTKQGLRQDDAAARLRQYGLSRWQRGTVAQAETGSRRLSVEELLVFALAYETTPAAFITGEDTAQVELAPGTHLTVAVLRELLSGHPVAVPSSDPQPVDHSGLGPGKSARSGRFPDVLAQARRFGIRRHSEVDRAIGGVGDAERHAARKLGTSPEQINLAALACWNRTLTEERDHRVAADAPADASPRQLQALRGHLTRELTTELATQLRTRGLI